MPMREGFIYCVCNPLFPHLVKIGKTTDMEERFKSSLLPEDFDVLWKYKVNDMDAVEQSVHRACKEFRYKSSKEFFHKSAVEKAEECVLPHEIPKPVNKGKKGKKGPTSTFKKAGIPIGSKLHLSYKEGHKHEGKEVTVIDDKNQVEFKLDGKVEKITISPAALKLINDGRSDKLEAVNGFNYFKYKGERITDIIKSRRRE